jgi:nucleoside-diphosphate-sugar epimerase
MLKDRNILVTGAAGFIGSNLVDALLAEQQLLLHDRVPAGWGSNLRDVGWEWIVPSIMAGSIAVTGVAFVVKRRKSRGVSAAVQE